MKESITKFDLEAAFKALDEIEMPEAGKVRANKPALTEIFSRKSKFDSLMEEYYDISDMAELDDAKEAREAEVAQAKLARIEKIVDLDAESPEDLLPSYVGKFIMQCPQCMTLFYKDPEDVEASEEDPSTVNINEVCQHCGNEAGYTLIGKVGEATKEETAVANEEETVDVTSTEEEGLAEEPTEEEPVEESSEDEEVELDLDELDLELVDDEEVEEEKTEESFNRANGEQTLVEELTEGAELDVSADDFEKLINSPEFKKPISDSEARSMMNELDADKEETAIEESVKINNELLSYAVLNPDGTYAGVPCVTEDEARELAAQKDGRVIVELGTAEKDTFNKIKAADLVPGMSIMLKDDSIGEVIEIGESKIGNAVSVVLKLNNGTTEMLNIGADYELSIFMPTASNESIELDTAIGEMEELQEASLEKYISDSLIESYGNVAGFRLSDCAYINEQLSINGTIFFTSGKKRKTTYTFSEAAHAEHGKVCFKGLNEKLGTDKQFIITGRTDSNKTFITESFKVVKK